MSFLIWGITLVTLGYETRYKRVVLDSLGDLLENLKVLDFPGAFTYSFSSLCCDHTYWRQNQIINY